MDQKGSLARFLKFRKVRDKTLNDIWAKSPKFLLTVRSRVPFARAKWKRVAQVPVCLSGILRVNSGNLAALPGHTPLASLRLLPPSTKWATMY